MGARAARPEPSAPHEPHPTHALAAFPERTHLPLPTPPFHILLPSSARLATSVAARRRAVAAARAHHVGAPAAASPAAVAAAATAAALLLLLPPPLPPPLLRPLLPAQGNLLYGVLRPGQRRRCRLAGGLAAHLLFPHPRLPLERTPPPFSHPSSPTAASTHLTRTLTHTYTHTRAHAEAEVEVQTADRRPQTGHPFPIARELE